MIKRAITISFIFSTLACGPDTIVIIPQEQVDLPIDQLEFLESNSAPEEQLFYAERLVFEQEEPAQEEQPVEEQSAEEEPVQQEPAQEEQPAEEEQPVEEEPAEEEPVEEEPVQEEEPAEEEPVQEEQPVEEEPVEEEPAQEEQPAEEQPVEEEPAEEEPVQEEEPAEEEPVEEEPAQEEFSGECDLGGNIYNFQSSCPSPFACLSRHVDNANGAPETGFCGKVCFGDINCPGDTLCVMDGVTGGVGYCER